MAPPSQLSIATSSLLRLVKEESSYHKELQGQLARIENLDQTDENAEYILKQEKKGIEETNAMFPELRDRIKVAMARLDSQLEAVEEAGSNSNTEEISKAKEAMTQAKTSYKEMASVNDS
ncbi:hypothetical protein MMC26_001057 [Xylographa opegraphella]|nr:hypothetical protein [Xylographa opegraphella]